MPHYDWEHEKAEIARRAKRRRDMIFLLLVAAAAIAGANHIPNPHYWF